MNYQKHYNLLINKAQNRTLPKEIYTEIHHIIPRCKGGTNEEWNLVSLLPEEHVVAHLLLAKIEPDNYSYIRAADLMTNRTRGYNKKHGWLRKRAAKKHSEFMKEFSNTPKKIEEKRDMMFELWKNPEFVQKQRDDAKKQWEDPEFREFKTNHSKNLWKNPEFVQKQRDDAKKQWEDPEFRELWYSKMGIHWKDPDWQNNMSITVKEAMQKQEWRSKAAKSRGTPTYKITDPEGSEYIIEYGIGRFAASKNLSTDTFQKMIKGWVPTKRSNAYGWKCEIVE